MKRRIVLKLSGEALAGDLKVGIDPIKVKNIAEEVKLLVDTVDVELSIVIGAGNIWRGRDAAAMGIDRSSADYMGMIATILNALALQNALETLGLETRAMTSLEIPSVAEPYIRRKALGHLEKGRIVIFGGGNGIPFFSTDTTAALRSAELGAELILMAKNGVDGVYSDDPKTNPNATRYANLTYNDVISQGLKVMDMTAATLCSENKVNTLVFDMNVKGNIARAAKDVTIGTLITN